MKPPLLISQKIVLPKLNFFFVMMQYYHQGNVIHLRKMLKANSLCQIECKVLQYRDVMKLVFS